MASRYLEQHRAVLCIWNCPLKRCSMLIFRPVQSRGFTLIEATLSVAIVGILLVVSTGTFGSIARSRKQQVESRMAYLLAQQLMTEIMQCYFQQQGSNPAFGPVAGQPRSA